MRFLKCKQISDMLCVSFMPVYRVYPVSQIPKRQHCMQLVSNPMPMPLCPTQCLCLRLCFDLPCILLSNNFPLCPTIRPSPLGSLSHLRFSIQITKIRLPPNGNEPSKNTPVLRGYESKAERSNRWPKFARIEHRDRHRSLYPIPHFRQRVTREERLHAEEIGVEDRGEAYLVYCDFRSQRKDFGGVVEVVAQEHEPVQS